MTIGITELFAPPPPANAVFPPAAFNVTPPVAPPVAAVAPAAAPTAQVPAAQIPTDPPAQGAAVQPGERPRSGSRIVRRRMVAAVAGGAALVLVGSGAYASAHKTVTLDVDGKITTVATYAGSVERLLAEEGIRVGSADLLMPAPSKALRDGGLVVVRYGHEVMVEIDGERAAVRLAALDADEALARLGHLADANALVRLLPNRDGERAVLPLRLDTAGPVALVADGTTRTVPDGATLLDAFLADAGITLDDDDRVSVIREPAVGPGVPTVRVVVQRVETTDVATVTAIPFETITREDPARYVDLPPAEVQAGVPGEHTRVDAVTTVDGVEQSRALVSDGVTRLPLPQVLAQGTLVRPAPSSTAGSGTARQEAPAAQPAAGPQPGLATDPQPDWGGGSWDDWEPDRWDGGRDGGWTDSDPDGDRHRDGRGGRDRDRGDGGSASSMSCSACAEPGLR